MFHQLDEFDLFGFLRNFTELPENVREQNLPLTELLAKVNFPRTFQGRFAFRK